MVKQTLAVGKEVDSWCTKCRLILAHTIESIAEGKITRVHCKTCGAQHTYRPNAPGTKSASTKSASGTRSAAGRSKLSKLSPEEQYQAMLRGRTAAGARRYTPAEKFKASDLLSHPNFGLGVVTLDKGSNKIEVMFADGLKVLIHARG